MNWKVACVLFALLGGAVTLVSGCSGINSGPGTKVTFSLPGKGVTREKIAATCTYLIRRGQRTLDVRQPMVSSVSDDFLVLLLSDKKVPKENVGKLLAVSSIELYHLKNLATQNHPNRPWTLKPPSQKDGPLLFLGPEAMRIDGYKDSKDLLREVAGYPSEKPVLTGKNILPTAIMRAVKTGWVVLVQFDKNGSKAFYEFTKNNPGEYLAVFCNGELLSAPVVRKPVEGGGVFITGFKSIDSAQSVVDEINAGNLPMKLKIKSVEYY